MGRGQGTATATSGATAQRKKVICNCRIGNPGRWIGEGLGETGLTVVKNTDDCQLHGADVKAGKICYACGTKLQGSGLHYAGLCGRCSDQMDQDETRWMALGAGS